MIVKHHVCGCVKSSLCTYGQKHETVSLYHYKTIFDKESSRILKWSVFHLSHLQMVRNSQTLFQIIALTLKSIL